MAKKLSSFKSDAVKLCQKLQKKALVIEAVTKLKTVDEIANFLVKQKIKGDIGSAESCPLAIYFEKNGFEEATVNSSDIYLDEQSYQTTKAISNFVSEFDSIEGLQNNVEDAKNELMWAEHDDDVNLCKENLKEAKQILQKKKTLLKLVG